MQKHSPAIIAMGSNLGDRAQTLQRAIEALDKREAFEFLRVSSVWESAPMYVLEQPVFYNAVAIFGTTSTARQTLEVLMEVEESLGRERHVDKGPRTLDLDLLFFGGEVIVEDDLTVPHPSLDERAFVLAPLAELVPRWVHPVLDVTVSDLLAVCQNREQVVRLEGVELDPLFSGAGER